MPYSYPPYSRTPPRRVRRIVRPVELPRKQCPVTWPHERHNWSKESPLVRHCTGIPYIFEDPDWLEELALV